MAHRVYGKHYYCTFIAKIKRQRETQQPHANNTLRSTQKVTPRKMATIIVSQQGIMKKSHRS